MRESQPTWWQNLRSIMILPYPEWPVADIHRFRKQVVMRPFARTDHVYGSFPKDTLHSYTSHLARDVDVIWAERLYIGHAYLDYHHKTIVDLDDLESAKIRRDANTNCTAYSKYALLRESGRLARTERESVERFAGVAVCSPDDAQHFGPNAHRLWVIPNGVSDELIELKPLIREPKHAVFVGTMNYWPNEQAILYFYREILPRIRTKIPDFVLSIVGLKPTPSVQALYDGKQIFVHADVPQVAPFVQRASLSIVPLLVGGGTRLKILESLALGTPVVSTTVGAEGLDLQDGEHLVLADSPQHFSDAVIKLLTQTTLSDKIAKYGLQRVRDLYLWSAIRKQVKERCEALCSNLRNA